MCKLCRREFLKVSTATAAAAAGATLFGATPLAVAHMASTTPSAIATGCAFDCRHSHSVHSPILADRVHYLLVHDLGG